MSKPAAVNIVPKAHALLSASSADRWLTCTPSARLEELVPDRGSSFASDGTAAHAFAELRLRFLLGQIGNSEYAKTYRDAKVLYASETAAWMLSDWEAITEYVEYVMAQADRLDARVIIEARVDYSEYAEGGFGTSDALLISTKFGVVKSIDLKFGKGVPVSAKDNPQAKLYALGGLMGLTDAERAKIKQVEWTIHQPRLSYVGDDWCSVAELIQWAETVVAPAAKLAWEGKGKFAPSDKACRFCKIAATCRARVAENALIAMKDFMPMPDTRLQDATLEMSEVARILPSIDSWIAWANAFKEYALTQVRDNGQEIDGYKLVRGRANRKWDAEVDLHTELLALGVSETDIYETPEPAIRSVAQLEKKLGKPSFKPIAEKLVVTPDGTPALVPQSDPRPRIDREAEAKDDFK